MVKPMRSSRVHYGWVVAGAGFTALLASAAYRAVPGVLMVPLQDEFGWSRATISAAVSINLVVLGVRPKIPIRLLRRIRGASRHPRCSRGRATHHYRVRPEASTAPHQSHRPF